MSTSKSFWSGVPVLAKAIGGIVTGVVGVGSLLIALGVIGKSNSTPTVTTGGSGPTTSATSGGSGATASTTGSASFTVDRRVVGLKLLDKTAAVTVTNQGSAPLKVKAPEIDGPQGDQFKVVATECTKHAVAPDESCVLTVTYQGAAEAKATMTVTAENAKPVDVTLTGTLL